MLAHQSARLRAQFEDGESRRIINVERSPQQIVHTLVQPFPLVGVQLSVQYLRTLYLATIRNQSVHQLHIRHFQ